MPPYVKGFLLRRKIFKVLQDEELFQVLAHMLICTPFCRPGKSRGGRGQVRRNVTMDMTYPHGDVDDMIYQEEWFASAR